MIKARRFSFPFQWVALILNLSKCSEVWEKVKPLRRSKVIRRVQHTLTRHQPHWLLCCFTRLSVQSMNCFIFPLCLCVSVCVCVCVCVLCLCNCPFHRPSPAIKQQGDLSLLQTGKMGRLCRAWTRSHIHTVIYATHKQPPHWQGPSYEL